MPNELGPSISGISNVTPTETKAIVTLSLLAAFVDGEKHERERAEIQDCHGSPPGRKGQSVGSTVTMIFSE